MSTSLISLPLLKFSYALDASTETDKFSWKHTVQNLFVVFDSFRNGPGLRSKMMKIVQGSQTLESVDIEEKVKSALNVVESMRKYGIEIRNEQLPVSALVRCPLLAIRYNLPDSKIRRLQLKFTSESDFTTVYDLLISMGCRITHSIPASNCTASTKSENAGPSCPPSSLASLSSHSALPPTHVVGLNNQTTSIQPSFSQGLDAMSSVEVVRPQTMQTLLPSQISQSTAYEPIDPITSTTRPHCSHLQTITENEAASSQRPWTAPVSQVEDTLTWLVPPRRELPFQRTSTLQKATGICPIENSSRPSSSTADLPPLPKPNFVKDFARTTTRPTMTHYQSCNGYDGQQRGDLNGQQTHPPASDNSRGSTKERLSAHSDLQYSSIVRPSTSNATADLSEMAYLDRIITRISAEATPGDAENLAAYTTLPADERRTVINDWMMQHIEDDDFLTLCQDVWGCWQRIGLGL
ncbi:uncharacterized protein K441DRAFT_543983 [Cenococcum geophilum 1.58]|uniref:uncharacterized protein n=1 Tax=Cenococcum geophilum 1.58 TaxID=794803 RepID=UPI00358DDEF4|nr:hypothetical protein K441DRAFT_543983 [Cenococcum geophilum 1.58]